MLHSRVTFLWFIIFQKHRRNEWREKEKNYTTNEIYYSYFDFW